ncbi:trichohyalin-like isoform X1, partial [Clarias magur]
MPAWKRGIIQRRRAKQEAGAGKVKEAGREFEPIWKNSLACSQNDFVKRKQRKEMEKESNYEKMGGEEKEKYDQREDNTGKWRGRRIQMERTQERDIVDEMKEKDSDSNKGIKARDRDNAICPLISGIHTIKAENIIIIENRKGEREKAQRNGETENEYGLKQRMKMDLKKFLADGENMAEVCASEVLIIHPSIKEEKLKEDRKRRNEDESKITLSGTEKMGDEIEVTRVSQLISKFGRNCKLSCRSKSSDSFIPMEKLGQVKNQERERRDRKDECKPEGRGNAFGGVPKCSFSFSEQVYKEGRVLERRYSDCRKRQSEEVVEKGTKREEERKHSRNEEANEPDRNSQLCTFKAEMNRSKELSRQKGMIINNNKSDGREIKMEEIHRDKSDRKQETESMKVVDPVVNFSDGEVDSQSNTEERGMSVSWDETRHDGVIQAAEREKEREEDLLGEDYIAPSQSSSSSSSPSPPLGHTQPAMSRIYNLKPVTSRAGVCITERNLDVQTHTGGMIKIRSGGQFPPGPLKIKKEISSLRSVQHQVEQLHLQEQEVQKQNDEEASQKTSFQDQNIDMQKSQPHTIPKPSSEPRAQTQLPQISTSTTNSTNAQIEPTVRTTPLFTIRSASGGPGKRGATITITPRKPGPPGTPSSTVTTPKVSSSSVTPPKAPRNTPELRKNRYPTAEEIQVIGGYQNLERSCLLKNRASPKMLRVCFDDSQLESVCTYPSEESALGEQGYSNDWRGTEEKREDKDEEEEDEDGLIGAGRGINRVLRV